MEREVDPAVTVTESYAHPGVAFFHVAFKVVRLRLDSSRSSCPVVQCLPGMCVVVRAEIAGQLLTEI